MNSNKIKGLMTENGDTQEKLAAKLGVSKQLISLKFTRKSRFSLKMIEDIAQIYDVEVAYFFTNKKD